MWTESVKLAISAIEELIKELRQRIEEQEKGNR